VVLSRCIQELDSQSVSSFSDSLDTETNSVPQTLDLKSFPLSSSKMTKGSKQSMRKSAHSVGFVSGKMFAYQQSLKSPVEIVGVGLHSGQTATLRVLPAKPNTGLQFKRVDQEDKSQAEIQGRFDKVSDTQLCTKISNEDKISVGTVEHLLSALRAFQIDNAIIEIDGPEVPVLDGSAALICDALEKVSLQTQASPRQVIKILAPISVGDENCGATLYPGRGFELDFTVKFDCAAIGEQTYKYTFDLESYKSDISKARTFGFFEEVEHLRSLGLARGGSLDNAIVLKDGAVMNPDGLRYDNEFVRHKILDALGDLYLAGAQIEGLYVGVCAGHRVNNELVRALYANPTAWTLDYQFQDTEVEELKRAG